MYHPFAHIDGGRLWDVIVKDGRVQPARQPHPRQRPHQTEELPQTHCISIIASQNGYTAHLVHPLRRRVEYIWVGHGREWRVHQSDSVLGIILHSCLVTDTKKEIMGTSQSVAVFDLADPDSLEQIREFVR